MVTRRLQTRKKIKELASKSTLVHIEKVGNPFYNVIINGTIVKGYRQRRSCNRYIENLK